MAIIDCSYVFQEMIPKLREAIKPLRKTDFVLYLQYLALIEAIDAYLLGSGLTMCDFPFELDGVLKDQASYYLGNYDEISAGIQE